MTMTETELPVLLLSLMIPRQGLRERLMVGSSYTTNICFAIYCKTLSLIQSNVLGTRGFIFELLVVQIIGM